MNRPPQRQNQILPSGRAVAMVMFLGWPALLDPPSPYLALGIYWASLAVVVVCIGALVKRRRHVGS